MPVPANWTPEDIRRFWNYHGQKPQVFAEYFSFQVGDALVNLLNRSNAISGNWRILDFGCGPGFLLERLLKTGSDCYGFDFSNGTVDGVNSRFDGNQNWNGAISATGLPIDYESAFFDLVTCAETLEHLLDEAVSSTLDEIHRLLKPNGLALFTTPADEDLAKGAVYCPFCDHEFHHVQHVRSFTPEALSSLLAEHGFQVIYCAAIDLLEMQKNRNITKHNLVRTLKFFLNGVLDKISPIPARDGNYKAPRCGAGPNLCVIARRIQ